MVDAQAEAIVRCLVGVEPHEVVAAVRGTRPRRLEILSAGGTTVLARITTSLGTGVELGLTVELQRVPDGTRVTVAPGGTGGSRLTVAATTALAQVVDEAIAGRGIATAAV